MKYWCFGGGAVREKEETFPTEKGVAGRCSDGPWESDASPHQRIGDTLIGGLALSSGRGPTPHGGWSVPSLVEG